MYIAPEYQGRGIGSHVLRRVFEEAEGLAKKIRVGALRGSDSNRFYARHGFRQVSEGEFDIYYERPPRG